MLDRDRLISTEEKRPDAFHRDISLLDKRQRGKFSGIVKYALPLVVSAGVVVGNLPTSATDIFKNNAVPYTTDIRSKPARNVFAPHNVNLPITGIGKSTFPHIVSVSTKLPYDDLPLRSVDLPKADINRSTLVDAKKNIKIPDKYSYGVLQEHLSCLKQIYPSLLEILTIGKSVQGRELYTIKIGNGPNKVLAFGTSHAREVIATQGIMEFADRFLAMASKHSGGSLYGNYNVKDIMEHTTLYIVPMLNPDGVEIVYKGLPSSHPLYEKYKANPQTFKARYKSNFNGVDLNCQFSHRFDEYKNDPKNPKRPASQDWCGTVPLSEPETAAIAEFTTSLLPSVALTIHCTGSTIFSSGLKKVPAINDCGKRLAEAGKLTLAYPTGCDMVGYADWLGAEYEKYGILPYTIELGKIGEATPIPVTRLYGENAIIDNLVPIIITASIYCTPLSPWNVK